MTSPRVRLPNADVVWHDVGMMPARDAGYSIFHIPYAHRDFVFNLIQQWRKYTARGIHLAYLPRGTLEYEVRFGI